MSRSTEYEFVSANVEDIINTLIEKYQNMTGHTVHSADPENQFIAWIADVIVRERVNQNYVGNQNIPSRAEGQNLDALGEWIFNLKRNPAQAAKCTVRFTILSEQNTAIAIPAGTRVTDSAQLLIWYTTEDSVIAIGETYADVMCQCMTVGAIGNGYIAGQINSLIDIDNILFFKSCENINESDGGSEAENDDEYYKRLRLSLDSYSTAGAEGSYIFWAKSASNNIADVKAVRSKDGPGRVNIYALMDSGEIATETIKNAILAACNDDYIRPLTDYVQVLDPAIINYDINITYYISNNAQQSLSSIQASVQNAVNEYVKWQCEKLGRDINPSKLWLFLMQTGIKRAVISSPVFTILNDGQNGDSPQVAKAGKIIITNGGFEDE